MHRLSSKQRQVVECLDNCLAVACPGSGKTRVLVYKVQYILSVDPGARFLIVSFTADSAVEIRKRVIDVVGKEHARKIASGTFHSISLNQLKHAGFKGTIIGAGQMKQYVERALAECKLFDMPIDEAVALIETAKMTPDYQPGNDNHGRLFQTYADLTDRNKVIDFTDMISRTVRMMSNGEIKPKACTYLMIDEAQDIDLMQYAWAKAHIENGSKFTVVGDDDQSIYKFRRALGYAGMMMFRDEFDAELITLDTNFRSKEEILGAASTLILNNEIRVEKSLTADRGKGGVVSATVFATAASEAHAVIDKIKELCAGNPLPPSIKYSVPNGDGTDTVVEATANFGIKKHEWAVLARNRDNLRVLATTMKAEGIPHVFQGTDMWGELPVCLAVGLLSSLVTRKKAGFDLALHYAGIDESVLEQLHKDFGDDFSALFSGKANISKYGRGTEETIRDFVSQVQKWEKELEKDKDHRINNAVRGAFDWFIKNLDANRSDKDKNGKKDNSYQKEFNRLSACKEIMSGMRGKLRERIRMVTSKPEPPEDNSEFGSVLLGTLHSSKGLEFDNVWLLGVNDGVIPDIKEWTPETHEEERRLLYVGITRAKNTLHISTVGYPSSFIAETGIPLVTSTLNVEETAVAA